MRLFITELDNSGVTKNRTYKHLVKTYSTESHRLTKQIALLGYIFIFFSKKKFHFLHSSAFEILFFINMFPCEKV